MKAFVIKQNLDKSENVFRMQIHSSLGATLIKRFMLQRFLMETICSVDFSGKSDVALAIKEWA